MITTCSKCKGLYEAGSDEQANEVDRLCLRCVDWPRKCGDCGSGPVFTKNIKEELQYGNNPGVMLSCIVPLRICQACGFEFLDHEAEKIHDETVKAHLEKATT